LRELAPKRQHAYLVICMQHLLLIAAGGALGAVSRHFVNQAGLRLIGPEWPYGTFVVNVGGSLLIGLLVGWLALAGRPDANEIRYAFGIGFLGAFTTMSAYALDVAIMIERKTYGVALAYAAGTVVVSVLAVFAGLLIARRVFAP
jgi:CrcB protein